MRQINSKGFTLIELLVVIAIIGVLATMSTVAVNLARNKAKIAKAQNDIDEIYKAIASMANDSNSWPNHQTLGEVNLTANNEICGLDVNSAVCTTGLSDSSSGIIATDGIYGGWSGPYMHELPIDPWNHEYFFDSDYLVKDADNTPCDGDPLCHDVVVVGSYGPDGLALPNGISPPAYGADDIIKIIK